MVRKIVDGGKRMISGGCTQVVWVCGVDAGVGVECGVWVGRVGECSSQIHLLFHDRGAILPERRPRGRT
jgi:hypothetical protein